jgi:hypothetical protein
MAHRCPASRPLALTPIAELIGLARHIGLGQAM